MNHFFLVRIVPIIVALSVFFGGLLILQNCDFGGLGKKSNPFHGTDLEQFDMEGPSTARLVLSAFQRAYPAKVT
ncbi:MAG: hypothetical protein IJ441_09045, partial [Spirochaetaceae bacterium]|nr:hypothetical protein [Spirochaetaceae bacterium]